MDNEDIKGRFDNQDTILQEIRDIIVSHIAAEAEWKPAIQELVLLWRGSKIMSGLLATLCAGAATIWVFFSWARDHIK